MDMPVFGFGTFNNFSNPNAVETAVSQALQAGYRHIDCAELYSNETEIGKALTASAGAIDRKDLFLVSKVWNHHHDPDEVVRACKASIEALQCEYLDCYLIHWPVAWRRDDGIMLKDDDTIAVGEPSDTTVETTWRAMEGRQPLTLTRAVITPQR